MKTKSLDKKFIGICGYIKVNNKKNNSNNNNTKRFRKKLLKSKNKILAKFTKSSKNIVIKVEPSF